MFYGVKYAPSGITAEELFKYLEYVIAHGDGKSIVHTNSKPVTMVSCEVGCVLLEIKG